MKKEREIREEGPEALAESLEALNTRFESELGPELGGELARRTAHAHAAFVPGRCAVLGAWLDGRRLGLLQMCPADADPHTAEIRLLTVDLAHRGKGLGRALVERAVALARSRGFARISAKTPVVSPSAPHLYWSLGFKVVELGTLLAGGRTREILTVEKNLVG